MIGRADEPAAAPSRRERRRIRHRVERGDRETAASERPDGDQRLAQARVEHEDVDRWSHGG
jgi:hypothetical protein